jgi:hypothetical protein
MHDWIEVASQAFAAILVANFRPAEPIAVSHRGSNGGQMQQRRSNEVRGKPS